MRMIRTRRLSAAMLLTVVALVVGADAASAHVTVTAPGATRGGSDQEITFRVPVEKDIDTVGLKVALPTETPIADVLVEPVPGWTHTEKTVKLTTPIVTDDGNITDAVSEIDWSAQAGHGLAPGEFGAFTVIAGQLPDTPSLTFKAIQTYRDGSQVDWTQTEAPGSTADLDNPAPVLALSPASAAGATPASVATSNPAAVTTTASTEARSGSGRSGWALGLSILALVLAAGAVLRPALRRSAGAHD
jgi:uncharacterized protein